MVYSVNQLAKMAGISVRTLHYYDQIGLLRPERRSAGGYRQYGEEEAVRLQQILFFRELDFSLDEIKKILSRPDFDVLEALQSQRGLLTRKAERISRLLETLDRTISKLKGETEMSIREYYEGFSDEQVERYREEVRRRWGEEALNESESRVTRMGKKKFADLQAEGGGIFQAICDNMDKGPESPEVQALVARWRQWLENFYHYSDEAVLGLGRTYSQDPEFAKFFEKYHKDLAGFLTRAIEYYCSH